MSDPDDAARPADDVSVRPEGPPPMPRWVKTSLIVVGILLVLFLVLQLTGMLGQHGPGMHGG